MKVSFCGKWYFGYLTLKPQKDTQTSAGLCDLRSLKVYALTEPRPPARLMLSAGLLTDPDFGRIPDYVGNCRAPDSGRLSFVVCRLSLSFGLRIRLCSHKTA